MAYGATPGHHPHHHPTTWPIFCQLGKRKIPFGPQKLPNNLILGERDSVCLFVCRANQLVSMTLVLSHNLRLCQLHQLHLVNQTGQTAADSIAQDKGPTEEQRQMPKKV